MQCITECVAVDVHNLLLAELRVKLESCQVVGLLAMSINEQATGSKRELNVILPEETWQKLV